MKNLIAFSKQIDKTIPQYTESISRSGWVNYGSDALYFNLYPDYLVYLTNCSAKHNAILRNKALLIAGNGWNIDGLDPIAISFLSNPYNEENLNEIVYKVAYDLELFGSFCLEIIYSKDKTKISEINYVPTNRIRLSECGKWVYYSDNWSNLRKFNPEKYPIYDKKNHLSNQMFFVKEYRPGAEYYGQPGYLSCVNWINLEYEISSFHLNQIKKGFMPSKHINFPWMPQTEEERDDIVNQTKREFEGAEGEVNFITFGDTENNKVTIEPISGNGSDEMFIELGKSVTEGILIGHGFPRILLSTDNSDKGIFSKNEVLEALEVFQASYVTPKQRLIENAFNKLLRFNGSTSKLTLNKYELDIKKIENGNV